MPPDAKSNRGKTSSLSYLIGGASYQSSIRRVEKCAVIPRQQRAIGEVTRLLFLGID